MFPKPQTDVGLTGIISKLPNLRFRPALPEAFDHVVFESQLAGEPRKLFHAVEGILAAIEISPHRSSWFDPIGMQSLRENRYVRRRRYAVDNVAVNQRIKIGANLHVSPGRCDCSFDSRWF